ncbi:MAG: sugar ABC transporter permease [Anaerolineae bacterium]|nr:sugar ABC transporter permease [Anaerolineae bacterium]
MQNISQPAPNRTRWLTQETLVAWLFIIPSLLGVTVFVLVPTLRGFYLSFTDSDLINQASFIGLANYQRLIDDPQFWKSLAITSTYVLVNIPFQTVLALTLAMAMWRLTRSIVVRAIIFMPYLIPMLMVMLIWMTILHYDFGPVNGLLKLIGGPNARISFMGQELIIPTIAMINTWRYVGYTALLFFAGLQTIPLELYEAAEIDGASEWRIFRTITLPLLRPVTVFVLITSLVGSFQVYDSVAVATVPSGGPGDATRVIFWYIVNQAFVRFNMGYAAALAVALFIISMAIAWINMSYFRAGSSDLG